MVSSSRAEFVARAEQLREYVAQLEGGVEVPARDFAHLTLAVATDVITLLAQCPDLEDLATP
jgi:hypothetical protein